MKSHIEIIRHLYQQFASSDFEEIKTAFDKNIIWEQMAGFPGGGKYKGADAIIQNVFKGFRKDWDNWRTGVTAFIEGENFVFAIGYYEGRYKRTGKGMKAEFIHQYQLHNQKIVRFKQYTDTLLIANAMRLTEFSLS